MLIYLLWLEIHLDYVLYDSSLLTSRNTSQTCANEVFAGHITNVRLRWRMIYNLSSGFVLMRAFYDQNYAQSRPRWVNANV